MVDESLLHEIFSAFGSVNSCKIQSDQTGVAGYVGFDDYSEAWWPPAPPHAFCTAGPVVASTCQPSSTQSVQPIHAFALS